MRRKNMRLWLRKPEENKFYRKRTGNKACPLYFFGALWYNAKANMQ